MSIEGNSGPLFAPGEYCGWREDELLDPGGGGALLYADEEEV